MKIVFCWAGVSGYMAACWRALGDRDAAEVFVLAGDGREQTGGAQFAATTMQRINCHLLPQDRLTRWNDIAPPVMAAKPDVCVVSGWWNPAYRTLATQLATQGVAIIMGMDNSWRPSVRQRLGRYARWSYLSRIDRVVVAGERAAHLAAALGFSQHRIMRGLYGVDAKALGAAHEQRRADGSPWPRRFLFVGQYIERKGLDLLLRAYARYRAVVKEPWTLTCCGRGPLEPLIGQTDGAVDMGFVQPADLVEVFGDHGALVLPSRSDAWGVVIPEACAAGLPVVATSACGAVVELVREYYNGLVVEAGSVEDITEALVWIHHKGDDARHMGRRSTEMVAPYCADAWAERWVAMLQRLMGHS